MTHSNLPYYQESGNITPSRLLLGIAFIIAISIILAYVYGLIMYYSPLVYINAIICGAFGFILGLAANFAGRLAHLRSLSWRIGFGVAAGILGYLFHWSAYLPAVFNEGGVGPDIYLANAAMWTNPVNAFSSIQLLNTFGVWEIFGIANSGAFGAVVWLIEAAIIIGVPTYLAWGAKVHPYSESQGKYYDKYDVPDGYVGSIASPVSFIQAVQEDGFAPFEALEPPKPRLQYTFSVYFLEGENHHYLDVNRVTVVTGDDGKVNTETNLVIDNLTLTTETAKRVISELKAKKSALSMF
ncbi:MAG: hypothetical protein AAF828_00200 [Bacteroidota bacterium]